jgi:sulfite reductase beta subunit-like hemoprotein
MVDVGTKPAGDAASLDGHHHWRPNVIVPFLPEEVDNYETRVRQFRAGDGDPAAFRAFRLRQGVYGQRQPDNQMFRVKIPLGRLTPDQLETLGRIARDYTAWQRGHITTRENVQYHFVNMDDTAEIMRLLGESGLTSREACGNTVRNVTTCPLAGVCPEEVFDPTPYAVAYVRYLVRHETTQDMPRKWKTAFSGCTHDWAITPMHDIGYQAVVRQENGRERRGFRIVVGGGTSIQPLMAQALYEFVPVEEFLRVTEACLRVYNAADELRKNRMKARVKVLVNRIGIDGFRALVEQELKGDWAKGEYDLASLMDGEEEPVVPPPAGDFAPFPQNDAEFETWRHSNVVNQKQPSFCAVFIKLRLGNVTAEQFFTLAQIARHYASGMRTSQRQNLVFQWVRGEALYSLYQALHAKGLAEPGANEFSDVVSCPGTESCSLGITSSMSMAGHLWDTLRTLKVQDPLVRAIRINVSGCPDGCGQHHVAQIGFQGAAMKNSGAQIPAYEVYIGGSQVHPVRYGTRLKLKIPSKRIDEAILAITQHYAAQRQEGEPFNAFVDRLGVATFENVLRPISEVPALSKESINYYIDWGRTVLYKVDRGEGECAM